MNITMGNKIDQTKGILSFNRDFIFKIVYAQILLYIVIPLSYFDKYIYILQFIYYTKSYPLVSQILASGKKSHVTCMIIYS